MIVVSNRLVVLRVLKLAHSGFSAREIIEAAQFFNHTMPSGTIYSSLRAMEDRGWIMQIGEGTNETTGRVVKLFCLTDAGKKWVNEALERVKTFSAWSEPAQPIKRHETPTGRKRKARTSVGNMEVLSATRH